MNAQVALRGYNNVKVDAGVAGASPHGLIQMLYDGLLERMAQLKGAIEQKNIELKDRFLYLFKPPGWKHDGTGITTKELQNKN